MSEPIIEGKTKIIRPGLVDNAVILETKDELTGGDAAKRAKIGGIAAHKTTQCANVFQLLDKAGIPNAFLGKIGANELHMSHCDMLPLELVMRRYAFGSYLKREPRYATNGAPHRFDEVVCEVFHKYSVVMPTNVDMPTQMPEDRARELFLHGGEWAEGVYTDPYVNPRGDRWYLHPAKAPFSADNPLMDIEPVLATDELDSIVQAIMRPVFKVLEEAWAKVETTHGEIALVDIKIEVGRRHSDGKVVVADVIDNDSWRIWPGVNPANQLDKQCFRDGDDLSTVADNYELVAKLTDQFATGH